MSADRETPAAIRKRAEAYAEETRRRAARIADAFAAFEPPSPPPAKEPPPPRKKATERATRKRKR